MESSQNVGGTNSAQSTKGLDQVLNGCAACCDGVLDQAKNANASQDTLRRLEEARDLCRSIAEELG
jgi:hypothetical protein